MKPYRLIITLSLLFFLIRLPYLDQLFLLHDERDIVLSGYSIAHTDKDLFGHKLPLSFNGISPNNPVVAIYYSALWSLINPYRSVFYARLPFVIVSTLLIFLAYLLIFELTKDKIKAILTTVFFCFSPWVFHVTRLALDIPLAIVLLIAGMFFYLRKKTIISYFFFFLTFYTYQGFRLLIPFLIIYLALFDYIQKKDIKKFSKRILIDIFFILILVGSTLVVDAKVTQSRLGEIIFFNTDKTSAEVIFERITSVAPEKLKTVFSNKLTVAFDYILTNLVKGQDLIYLFKEGDYSAINGNTASGQFFLVFIALYYLGIASLGRKVKKEDLYIIGFCLIGMIPSLLSTNGASFAIRSMLSGIGFAYIIGLGIIFSYSLLSKSKYKRKVIYGFGILLIFNFAYFSYTYFFRRPVTVGEMFNENERQFAIYAQQNKNTKLSVYHNLPQDLYLSTVFFSNKTSDMAEIQNNLSGHKNYSFNNLTFIQCDSRLDYTKLRKSVIDERCLSPKLYDIFSNVTNKKVVGKIPYKDYSTKTAYFVTE